MLWRPAWAVIIAAVELLVAVSALTLWMALRVMIPDDNMIDGGRDLVTSKELVNHLIVGSILYFTWVRGIQSLKVSNIAEWDD